MRDEVAHRLLTNWERLGSGNFLNHIVCFTFCLPCPLLLESPISMFYFLRCGPISFPYLVLLFSNIPFSSHPLPAQTLILQSQMHVETSLYPPSISPFLLPYLLFHFFALLSFPVHRGEAGCQFQSAEGFIQIRNASISLSPLLSLMQALTLSPAFRGSRHPSEVPRAQLVQGDDVCGELGDEGKERLGGNQGGSSTEGVQICLVGPVSPLVSCLSHVCH